MTGTAGLVCPRSLSALLSRVSRVSVPRGAHVRPVASPGRPSRRAEALTPFPGLGRTARTARRFPGPGGTPPVKEGHVLRTDTDGADTRPTATPAAPEATGRVSPPRTGRGATGVFVGRGRGRRTGAVVPEVSTGPRGRSAATTGTGRPEAGGTGRRRPPTKGRAAATVARPKTRPARRRSCRVGRQRQQGLRGASPVRPAATADETHVFTAPAGT